MPSVDLTPYYQPQGSTSDGTKFDNLLAVVQTTLNGIDNNNVAAAAAIAASKLAGIATVLGTQNVGAANTDLQGPGASRSDLYVVTTGTGTVRSIGAPTENGSRVVIRNASGSSITLKHQLAGGTGAQLYLRTVADVTLLDKELLEFVYDGTNWVEVNRDQAAAAAGAVSYRKTTTKTVNNTVTETDLLNGEITVGAGVLGTTGVLRLTAWGDWLQNSGGALRSPQWKVKLGATTLLDVGDQTGTAFGNDTIRYWWKFVVEIRNQGAANVQEVSIEGKIFGALSTNGSKVFATGTGVTDYVSGTAGQFGTVAGRNAGAVDTTASQALVLSVINPTASVSMETKLIGALAEVV